MSGTRPHLRFHHGYMWLSAKLSFARMLLIPYFSTVLRL